MSTRRLQRCAATAPSLLPPTPYRLPTLPRRGISLLEVLISMFVLLFGLMGVASIFPVGNYHAGKGDQYDRGAALTEAAFAELHARGMLRPQYWMYADGTSVMNPLGDPTSTFAITGADGPGHAFVIDPLGAANVSLNVLSLNVLPLTAVDPTPGVQDPNPDPEDNPYAAGPAPEKLSGSKFPLRRIRLPQASGKLKLPVAETMFRLRDDLTNELPKQSDRPGVQRWRTDASGNLLQREYAGNYSWLATVVPTSRTGVGDLQPAAGMAGSAQYEVSVAVFYNRELPPSAISERSIPVEIYGNEMEVSGNPALIDLAFEGIRSGNWIALIGVKPGDNSTGGQFLLKWYRLLSLDRETELEKNSNRSGDRYLRRAMLDGPEWPPDATGQVRAILMPGIINVSTQVVTMERD
jgi:Tfp pilus assembly protein PilV